MSLWDNIRFKNISKSHRVELSIDTNDLREALSEEFKTSSIGFSLLKDDSQQRYTGRWIEQNHFQLIAIQQVISGRGLFQLLSYQGKIKSLGKGISEIEVLVGPSPFLRILTYLMILIPIGLIYLPITDFSLKSVGLFGGFTFISAYTINNFLASFENASNRAGAVVEVELQKMIERRKA